MPEGVEKRPRRRGLVPCDKLLRSCGGNVTIDATSSFPEIIALGNLMTTLTMSRVG